MPGSLVYDAWRDLKDLKEVCPECRICSQLGDKLYAQHLYISHLRRRRSEREVEPIEFPWIESEVLNLR